MRLSEIIVEHGDKWERDSEGNGIGWGFKDDEREARKYGHRTGDRSGPGSKALTRDEAEKMYGNSLNDVELCPTCHGDKTVVVGDSQLVFDCSTCKGRGYFGPEHGMSKDIEELEEIKVTKTVAGKRASASQTLAGKLKKKKPNQGKKPVELDKMKDAKELANNLIKGQYKS